VCLGIPGRVAALDATNPHLATVEVTGVRRRINVGLLEDEDLAVGDWVLIHVGFAMSRIDEAEAERALEGLRLMGVGFDEELAQLLKTDPR
jgi:hydrogenase expression/formation protein HypC